ncbi:hypothetical protein PT974_07366 [Cladobotryum mycophilum]|uniref:Uncharacterized protein n=1 Tax=Cladobotryum mycophilum TaxID=491253 RepID=A0ABR0SP17_9HYPO
MQYDSPDQFASGIFSGYIQGGNLTIQTDKDVKILGRIQEPVSDVTGLIGRLNWIETN